MARFLELPVYKDNRGSLVSIEKCLPFQINRTYFIYDIKGPERGGHRHIVCWQAILAISGYCEIYCNNGFIKNKYVMDSPKNLLILQPEDWHKISDFEENTILCVFASHHYDIKDYIYEDYK